MKEFSIFCPYCGKNYNKNELLFQCSCGKALSIKYLIDNDIKLVTNKHMNCMWRYTSLLPFDIESNEAISFGEGATPLLKDIYNDKKFFIKLESINPSGSFKDRGVSLVISHLKSIGIKEFLEDSSGNAGLSYTMYAAKAMLHAHIFVPNYLSEHRLFHLNLLNAKVTIIPGSRKDVAEAAICASKDIFYASHAWSPLFLHGVKTIAYEIYESLNTKHLPPIYVPTGNGTLLLGLYLGFKDLLALKLIHELPRLYAVQPENCAPLKYFKEHNSLDGFKSTYSVAEGTLIEKPPRIIEMLNAVDKSKGKIITISEETIIDAFKVINRKGYFIEPTSALAFASFMEQPEGNGVVVLTGSALKIGSFNKLNQ